MSWVEKNRKINNRGGDGYSGLESKLKIILANVARQIHEGEH